MPKEYLITISHDARGAWRFKFQGSLKWWQKYLIQLAGWKITDL